MKKLLVPVLFLIMPVIASGQFNGDGSSGNPFYGTTTSAVQWSVGNPAYGSTVYIGTSSNPDITVGNGGSLTIDPGITVVFTQLASDLIITGSGILTAEGTSPDHIVFTKDGSIAHRGHITFETPGSTTPITGTGSFSFCDIDYGYSTGAFPNPNSTGGAIQVNAPNVVIENCRFENNYARFGGAVTVNAGQNTMIRNCIFKSNDAIECAGALLLHLNSSATVENCIFEDNYCAGSTQAFYGGGAIWIRQSTSKIVNCTFLNNSSPRAGDALYSYASPGSRIINSIFWGSNDQFATNGTGYSITNCAFETIRPASAVNSIILNSNNSASDGPNFIATDGSDWSIKLISPCRDAGTTPAPTVPNDFIGNPRIGPYDIGAYEVQYSRWTGASSTSWSELANWEGNIDPSTGTGDVVIPAGLSIYPVNSSNPAFTIATGKLMIMESGSKATLASILNNGSLLLESDATGMSSLITDSYSGNSADVELFLTGGPVPDGYRWHLISSPFTSCSITPVSSVTLNLAHWIENWDRMSLDEGWVAYDGFIYPGGPMGGPTFNNFSPGKGYTYYYSTTRTYTLSGQFNTSDQTVGIACTNTDLPLLYGHNLVGNPFPSGLDWDAIINNAGYPANTSKALHYRKDGTHVYYVNGVGSEPGVTGIIPPMQGFFVKGYDASVSLNLAAGARVHDNIPARYKGKGPEIPIVRLKINTGELYDYTTVRFDESAKAGLDFEFDAVKDFLSTARPSIYTVSEGTKFVINGLPFPSPSQDIPVAVRFITDGIHSISTTDLSVPEKYNVYLLDNTTGSIINLRTEPIVTFTSASGLFADRFTLRVTELSTTVEDPVLPGKNSFILYYSNGSINIRPGTDEWDNKLGSVNVFDISGRTISNLANCQFNRNSVIQLGSPVVNGLYLVEIRSGNMRFVGKVVVK